MKKYWSICNCNWGTCIAPPTRRPRLHHRVIPYLGARRQNKTEMFSDHDQMSLSIAAVSALSVACSMLTMPQQKRLCRQFSNVSAARRGCRTMKCAVQINLEYWQPMSEGLRYILACVPEATCEPASTACTGSSQRLASGIQCNSRRTGVTQSLGYAEVTVL